MSTKVGLTEKRRPRKKPVAAVCYECGREFESCFYWEKFCPDCIANTKGVRDDQHRARVKCDGCGQYFWARSGFHKACSEECAVNRKKPDGWKGEPRYVAIRKSLAERDVALGLPPVASRQFTARGCVVEVRGQLARAYKW